MKLTIKAIALFMLLGTQLVNAQVKTADIIKEWERSKAYTKEYLDAMPESGYTLKPTPQMRSFAEQMLHIADANYGLASSALNVESPVELGALEKSADKSKANVTRLVLESYDYIISSIMKMTEAQLSEQVKMIGSFDMDKRTGLAKTLEHQAHHRGQTTVYLRLAGITPPQEKLF